MSPLRENDSFNDEFKEISNNSLLSGIYAYLDISGGVDGYRGA